MTPKTEGCDMNRAWDVETIDPIIERIKRLEDENKTMRIGFGKYLAGYRPGDELWNEHDQRALDLAQGVARNESS